MKVSSKNLYAQGIKALTATDSLNLSHPLGRAGLLLVISYLQTQ